MGVGRDPGNRALIRVLVADDDPLVRKGLVSLLDAEPDLDVVAEADTAARAIQQARRLDPDVVLLHVDAPGMDGMRAAARLSGLARVLVLAHGDDEPSVTAALRSGASGYLVHRQLTPDTLVGAVRELAQGGTVIAGTAVKALVEAVRRAPSSRRSAEEFGLTPREEEVIGELVGGKSNRAISRELYLSEKTVKNHLGRIYAKLSASSRGEAIAIWLGAVPPERADAPRQAPGDPGRGK